MVIQTFYGHKRVRLFRIIAVNTLYSVVLIIIHFQVVDALNEFLT